MKNFKLLFSMAMIAIVAVVTSCSKTTESDTVDKVALGTLIAQAEAIATDAVVGTLPGEYPESEKTAFSNAIGAAKDVYNNANATQAQVDSALATLSTAITTFQAAVIEGVSKKTLFDAIATATATNNISFVGYAVGEYRKANKDIFEKAIADAQSVYDNADATATEVSNAVSDLNTARTVFIATANTKDYDPYLAVHLKMDGNLNDESYFENVATLVDRGVLPTLTTDRFGKENSAYLFTSGCISIPNTEELRKEEITVTFWAKADITITPPSDQGIVSLYWWNGFLIKRTNNWGRDSFYAQAINMPAGAYYGVWNQNFATYGWHHIAVVFAKSYCRIYVNGVKDDNCDAEYATPTPLALPSEEPLCIGALSVASDTYPFIGALDEFRYYSKPLNAAEVLEIYNSEK